MKILYKGQNVYFATHKVVCQKCRAILEIDARDLNIEGEYCSYKCPCCGVKNKFLKNKLPEHILTDVEKILD